MSDEKKEEGCIEDRKVDPFEADYDLMRRLAEKITPFMMRQPKEVAIGAIFGALMDAYELGRGRPMLRKI